MHSSGDWIWTKTLRWNPKRKKRKKIHIRFKIQRLFTGFMKILLCFVFWFHVFSRQIFSRRHFFLVSLHEQSRRYQFEDLDRFEVLPRICTFYHQTKKASHSSRFLFFLDAKQTPQITLMKGIINSNAFIVWW